MVRMFGLLCLAVIVMTAAGCERVDLTSQFVPRSEFEELKGKFAKLEADAIRLSELQLNNETQLAQIAKRDVYGYSHPRLDAKNQSFREEFARATRETAPELGRLFVNNRLGYDVYLVVNGDYRLIPALDSRSLLVPRGTARVALPGTPMQYYAIASPDFNQALDIR